MAKHLARKRFGQHFLTDVNIIEAIVDAIDPRQGDALVEIGPGLGAMTLPLLKRIKPFSVIELDRQANELLDVFVNGTLIGRGEVVTVGDRFGVKMTELVNPDKRG